MWGFMLWAASHIAARGDLKSLIFFGGLLAVAGIGTVLMDARKIQSGLGALRGGELQRALRRHRPGPQPPGLARDRRYGQPPGWPCSSWYCWYTPSYASAVVESIMLRTCEMRLAGKPPHFASQGLDHAGRLQRHATTSLTKPPGRARRAGRRREQAVGAAARDVSRLPRIVPRSRPRPHAVAGSAGGAGLEGLVQPRAEIRGGGVCSLPE